MRAVILAAGVSRRLYPLTFDIPKCLLEIGGKPIIDHQLKSLQANGIKEVTIVLGYYRELLLEHIVHTFPHLQFDVVVNHHFFETNTAYSLYLCRDRLKQSAHVLMNADVLYPVQLLKRLLDAGEGSMLAVQTEACGDEEVKVIEGGEKRIVAIGKELIQENALGEFIGVAKFSVEFSIRFAESLQRLIEAGGKADYFEAAIHPLLGEIPVHYVDVSDLPCIEVDFLEDLNRARDLARSEWFS